MFTAICLSKPHILLLDEPTNHLDMQARRTASCACIIKLNGIAPWSLQCRMLWGSCCGRAEGVQPGCCTRL